MRTILYYIGYLIGAIIAIMVVPIALVYHIAKRIFNSFNSEEYENAWQVMSVGYDGEDHSAILKALSTSFTSDDDGNLYVTDYSGGEQIWKQVGRDE